MPTILLLDGPTGTELERRGFSTSHRLWSARAILEAPELLLQIHREYIEAGADILTANTFRTNVRAVVAAGGSRDDALRMTHRAVELALEARSRWATAPMIVVGSLAPAEDCYTPDLVPDEAALIREHEDHVTALQDAGCDAVLVETMNTAREALAAARACAARGVRFLVSVVPDQSGTRILSGEALGAVLDRLGSSGAEALLVNCASPSATIRAVDTLRETQHATGAAWKFGVFANGSEPHPELGYRQMQPVGLDAYLASVAYAIDVGAEIVGSCCGTTPETTRAIRRLIERHVRTRGTVNNE